MWIGDVSQAWLVWSRAAETALADAYCFSGGPAPSHGLVLGREVARFRLVRLGCHKVRKVRGNAVDVHDAVDVFLHRDSSVAPLLDMRRMFQAGMDVLDAMILYGVSLSRSVELTAQWDRILAAGPLCPVALDDLNEVRGLGIGDFHCIVSDIHHRLSDFIHAVLVRRDEAIGEWRNWIREDPMVSQVGGSDLIWFSHLLFFSASLNLLLVVLGFLLIQPGLKRNSERLDFPTFAALCKATPALRNSMRRLMAGCPYSLRFICHP